ncbi:MAG: 3-methyl-2-oxobutanoate hydroxymethyltransferase [bacterium]|nr:3-methyl-2-oxobutanoate hydroxymethyltransferase [bacterium]
MARLTVRDIRKMKEDGIPIPVLTAYDAPSAKICAAAGVPVILVGDSLGMVVQGHETPIPVTLDQMIYHASMVSRAASTPLIIGDLPFMTYSISPEQALTNAARLVQEGGVTAVKLEGGETFAPTIERIVRAGIPVVGHIGLTPQSVNQLGGMRVQGRDLDSARQLLRDSQAVQAAGAFAVVLESMPAPLGKMITDALDIPTIGIGAGPDCDGQVQVWHDLLGIFDEFVPRHTRRYAELGQVIHDAVGAYVRDVQARSFPTEANSFTMKEDIVESLRTNGTETHAGS